MNDSLSWCMLVLFHFHDVTSLHTPHLILSLVAIIYM